jgi:hypothetical protein
MRRPTACASRYSLFAAMCARRCTPPAGADVSLEPKPDSRQKSAASIFTDNRSDVLITAWDQSCGFGYRLSQQASHVRAPRWMVGTASVRRASAYAGMTEHVSSVDRLGVSGELHGSSPQFPSGQQSGLSCCQVHSSHSYLGRGRLAAGTSEQASHDETCRACGGRG